MSRIRFGDVLYIKGRIGWQLLRKDEYLKEGDYYLVTGVDITDTHRIDFDQCYFVSKERYETDDKIQLKVGDIIVTKDGTIGKIGIIDKLDKPATLNSHLFLIRNERPDILDTGYLFQVLRSTAFQKYASNNTSGSNIPAFTQANIANFEIDLPSMKVQQKVAKALYDIDEKIISNININSELESIAKTIYDYWFLQFEFPNEEGRPYKSSGGKMVWNDELKREIPEGWELTTLGEMFHITMGSSPKGDSLNEVKCGIEFYQGSTDFGNIYPNERVYTTSPIRKATSQDVLLSVRAPVGDMNIAMNDCCIGRGLAAIHSESTLLTWNTLKSLHSYFDVYNNNGTTFGALTADSLKGLITLNIPPRLIQEYEKQVSGFEKIIRNKELESRSLSSLRDFLLPMLMNGQVTFKDN